ncbi:MAG: D-hexose-6-phosphate mutarotase [Gammaproteobacteria bacterium]|nr:D-hexose-6-phosphate mutarotase [Gammaproteobacteria bacterium]
MTDLATLNARFAIPEQLTFREGPGGLPVAEVTNDQAIATIALQGAHLLTWTPSGVAPVIWLSSQAKFAPGKSVRGGVPICWPWFGAHVSESAFPAHGFARSVMWEVISSHAPSADETHIAFRLLTTEAARAQWPHATPVECHMSIGKTLEIELITRNEDTAPVTIGQALHTYFEIADIEDIDIDGLDDCDYLDKVDNFARKRQHDAVTFDGEVDRVYLNSVDDCIINDHGHQRQIVISKRGSASTVVWNPWQDKATKMGDLGDDGYRQMVCVESANAADDVVTIAPGQSHSLWVQYRVE